MVFDNDFALRKIENANSTISSLNFNQSYLEAYPSLLISCEILVKALGQNSILPIAHIVYGWMPTILKNISRLDTQKGLIFTATGVTCLKEALRLVEQIDAPAINNSWVGLSKVLHFLKPTVFPIWDSNIALLFKTRRVNNKAAFINFLKFTHQNRDNHNVILLREFYQEATTVEISNIRAIELLMFEIGKEEKAVNKILKRTE